MKSLNISRMDWNQLRLFYLMVQSPTLTQAALHLNMSQPQLSRQLANLEYRLGYRLCARSSKGLSLLKEGNDLLQVISKFFQEFAHYETQLTQQQKQVQGLVRLLVSSALPVLWLVRDTQHFLKQYLDIQFSLIQSQSLTSSFVQQADCAIQRFDSFRADDLIQRPLLSLSYGLYISQSYRDQHGPFNDFEVLKHHPKILLKSDTCTPWGWPKICDPKEGKVHEFSTAQDILWATQQGFGVAALPRCQAVEFPDLVSLPFYFEEQTVKLYYAYPNYYKNLKRVTLYGDFLEHYLSSERRPPNTHTRRHDLPLLT